MFIVIKLLLLLLMNKLYGVMRCLNFQYYILDLRT